MSIPQRRRRRLLLFLGFWLLVFGIWCFAGPSLMLWLSPPTVGLIDGRLRPCPGTPNCVCSQATSPSEQIAPLEFTGDAQAAWERLQAVLKALPRTKIVTVDGHSLHATCTSLLFRFVDDVECVLDPAASVIHIRSASRLGLSDLGVNRARVEDIRRRFAQSP
jgi:uncharacterized protein (DUF1499 family)